MKRRGFLKSLGGIIGLATAIPALAHVKPMPPPPQGCSCPKPKTPTQVSEAAHKVCPMGSVYHGPFPDGKNIQVGSMWMRPIEGQTAVEFYVYDGTNWILLKP